MDEMLTRIFKCIGVKRGAQKELAEYLGIHPNVITNWKNGSNKSYRGYVNEIASYFNVSVDYLLTGEQKEEAPIDVVDEDLRDYLDELRNRPEMRMLFSTTKTATKAQIEAIVKMVEEMQGNK